MINHGPPHSRHLSAGMDRTYVNVKIIGDTNINIGLIGGGALASTSI